MALYVTAVDENSPAERFGLTVGCALLAIDGHPLNDALDYQFYTTPTSFSLEVCENEQHRTVQVTKAEYEPLGCNFKTYLGDESTAAPITVCSALLTSCRPVCGSRSILRMTTSGSPSCSATISR